MERDLENAWLAACVWSSGLSLYLRDWSLWRLFARPVAGVCVCVGGEGFIFRMVRIRLKHKHCLLQFICCICCLVSITEVKWAEERKSRGPNPYTSSESCILQNALHESKRFHLTDRRLLSKTLGNTTDFTTLRFKHQSYLQIVKKKQTKKTPLLIVAPTWSHICKVLTIRQLKLKLKTVWRLRLGLGVGFGAGLAKCW